MRPLTSEERRILRISKSNSSRSLAAGRVSRPTTFKPTPMLNDEALVGWGEIIGFAVVSLLATIGIAAISMVIWLILTVVAFPADLALPPPAPWLPNPQTTPGAINASIDQSNIAQTICAKSYRTGTVRPDVDYTNKLKTQQLAADSSYSSKNRKLYEEDHLVPLEIGGHPSDPRNLWPEFWQGKCGAHVKDDLENRLHELVCAGQLGLAEAQGEIATDWPRAYNAHVGPLSCP